MRLLLINQFFWPDVAPTGRFLLDVVRAVDARQAEMTVICGASSYEATKGLARSEQTAATKGLARSEQTAATKGLARSEQTAATKGLARSEQTAIDDTPRPPARILRPSAARFSRDVLGRLLSYGSFLAGVLVAGFRVGRPDTVVTLTTPPLTSVFGRMLKLSRGCRHFIWEMDIYPDIAVDIGTLDSRSMLACLIGALADWSRRNADGIIVLGEDMKARLIARDIPEHKIHVAENWADGREITPQPFPEGPLVVHYSGNFGLTHDFETIATVIRTYKNDPRFRFVFAGGGVRRENMETLCREQGIANALFRPYAVRARLSASLAEGHLGLVTQLPRTCGSIVPSKTYGIMAAGRPVLYIGPREATPARIIARCHCGWQVDPGDTAALATLLETLAFQRHLIVDAGARARQAFEQRYDRPMSTARIVNILGLKAEEAAEVSGLGNELQNTATAN